MKIVLFDKQNKIIVGVARNMDKAKAQWIAYKQHKPGAQLELRYI